MFDNLKIGKKMLVLSGTILLLLTMTVLWSAFGLSTTVDNGSQAAHGNKLRSDLLQLEIKHDAWNNKVSQFLNNPDIKELKVIVDPATCALGKWFHSDARTHAEELIPQIKSELAALEEPHRLMHLSGKRSKIFTLMPILNSHRRSTNWKTICLMDFDGSKRHPLRAQHHQRPDRLRKKFTDSVFEQCPGREECDPKPKAGPTVRNDQSPHKKLYGIATDISAALQRGDRVALVDLYAELTPTLAEIRKQFKELKAEADHLLAGQRQAKKIYVTETLPNLKKLKQHLSNIAQISSENLISDKQMIASATGTRNAVILIGVFALLAGMALSLLISRSLTRPMQKAVTMLGDLENGHLDTRLNMKRRDEIGQMAQTMDSFADSLQNEVINPLKKLADGDLTFEINVRDGRDQIRGSIKKLNEDLNQIMTRIHRASNQIDSGSSQVSASAQSLSDGAAQSAASVEEISSSMNEIGSQTRTSADYAQQANQLASSARSSADTGSERMAEMINAMGEINASGQNISKIIKVIDEIAFKPTSWRSMLR